MILTLGQPPTDSPLHVDEDQVDVSGHIHWTSWFSLIFNILLNVGPQLRVTAILDFPSTNPQDSSDLTIAVPGATALMQVSLGAPLPAAGSTFTAYAGTDIVTIRFYNGSAAPIDPASSEFRVAVHTGEQT